MKNNPKIIKVNPQNILPINEAWAATAGFSTSPDYGNPAFSYEIKPLSFTLCQKGNDPELLDKNNSFKFFVGDHVSGYCPYDGKKHEGMIKYFYWVPGSDGTMPKFVYIQDFSNEDTIPLEAESIKPTLTRYTPNDLSVKDYYRARDTEIAHDYGATEMPKTVFEDFDFNSNEKTLTLNEKLNQSEYDKIPEDSGFWNDDKLNFVKCNNGDPSYKNYEYFGDCINTVDVDEMWDATQMLHFLKTCEIIDNIDYVLDKLHDGDRHIRKDFIKAIHKLKKSGKLYDLSEIVAAVNFDQNILVIYITSLDTHFFFDCIGYYGEYETEPLNKDIKIKDQSFWDIIKEPFVKENFDFNSNGKTLNEQYAYLNEARVMAKKFFEDNFDLKQAKGFSFKQYVDKSTGAYVTTEPSDGKPTGTMKFFAKHGISKVYGGSIGFSEKEQKWYGWSHRAIYGFGIGSKVKKGDCGYKGKAWTAKTLDDAKQMAKDFADAVS